jgi:hypothetical protein
VGIMNTIIKYKIQITKRSSHPQTLNAVTEGRLLGLALGRLLGLALPPTTVKLVSPWSSAGSLSWALNVKVDDWRAGGRVGSQTWTYSREKPDGRTGRSLWRNPALILSSWFSLLFSLIMVFKSIKSLITSSRTLAFTTVRRLREQRKQSGLYPFPMFLFSPFSVRRSSCDGDRRTSAAIPTAPTAVRVCSTENLLTLLLTVPRLCCYCCRRRQCYKALLANGFFPPMTP